MEVSSQFHILASLAQENPLVPNE